LVVIGAGAAGLLAAYFSARQGVRTVLLEGSKQAGAKILISGGGRCNVLPGHFDEAAFFTQGSRNVLRRLFKTWPHAQVRAWFENEMGIVLVEQQETGKLFPEANRAKVVRDRLVSACEEAGVELLLNWRVDAIRCNDSASENFHIEGHHDGCPAEFSAARLVLATGGKSVPKTGSDGASYRFAEAFGHSLLPVYPALVPLTTGDDDLKQLSGLAHPVEWRAWQGNKPVDRGSNPMLLTHQGISGPAALDASHWFERDAARLTFAWDACDRQQWAERLQSTKARSAGVWLNEFLPKRLVGALLQRAQIDPATRLSQLPKARRRALLDLLSADEFKLTGSRGFAVAEVSGGGVPLAEVSPTTLESRKQSGLYLCGEMMDVIGRIGGHNFLWAWVTGKLAGTQAAQSLLAERAT